MSALGLGLIAGSSAIDAYRNAQMNDYLQAKRQAEMNTLDAKTQAENLGYMSQAAKSQANLDTSGDWTDTLRSEYQLRAAQNQANLGLVSPQTQSTLTGLQLGTARNTAGLETLPEQTATQTAQTQLSGAQARSNLGLLPAQTGNQASQLQLQGAQIGSAMARQPTEAEAQQFQAQQQRDTALMGSKLTEVNAQDLPRAVQLQRQAGIIKEADAQQAGLAALGQYFTTNNPQGAAQFLNEMNATVPEAHRLTAPVATVGTFPSDPSKPDSPRVLMALDKDGKPVTRPDGTIYQVPVAKLTGAQTMALKPGETLVRADTMGAVAPIYTAPAKNELYGERGHAPANVAEAEWIMKNRDNPEAMNAWQQVKSLKGGRKEFISNLLGKTTIGMEKPDVLAARAETFGKLYDSIEGGKQGNAPSPQPKGGAAPGGNPIDNLDPQVKKLLGL